MKKNPRAWSFLTIDGDRQYGGNNGYDDNPAEVYRYDSDVANYKQVSEDDVVVLRSKMEILGVARIEKIVFGKGPKDRQRCPHCRLTNIKLRSTMQPRWACHKCQHTFDDPITEIVTVDTFAAHYATTFRIPPTGLTLARLNDAVMRPSDQMSIKEIDLAKIEEWLKAEPESSQLIFDYANAISADAVLLPQDDPGSQSIIETRRRVLREISLRRGQSKFRDRLITRYGAACQISRCKFPGLIEAAHIRPYAQTSDNGVQNGVLLRTDLHTLFDLNMLAIDPTSLTVKLHPDVRAAGYAAFDGIPLFLNGTAGPDLAALSDRWELFQLLQAQSDASSESISAAILVE
ncbi:HNH endonuclease [Paraburkholderia fungorum]|uniref:HNH endonuclease n=1 Tax=Paraburkholderia fungorum TaxID=134537 RepID=UPI0004A9F60F|nr:HNH endonuclease signature motif containing protein [Paraburkholderia fungorum]KFX63362.1 hypothetical protein KBK24_0116660 [Burkholderia sp. K24]USX08234.1 HNH endonuclease [Paraburkholderia fungorum]